MNALHEILIAALLLAGAAFTLLGSLGLVRFSDVLLRLHGPTKAGTLGVGCILIASSLYFSLRGEGLSVHELLITLFLFLTAPVSAQLMARCALLERRQRERDSDDGGAKVPRPTRSDAQDRTSDAGE